MKLKQVISSLLHWFFFQVTIITFVKARNEKDVNGYEEKSYNISYMLKIKVVKRAVFEGSGCKRVWSWAQSTFMQVPEAPKHKSQSC